MPDPSASIAGDTAVSPWLVVMWEALSSSAAGCRAEGTLGVSLNHSELRGSKCTAPPEADLTGARDGPARTASTASRAVARRIARLAFVCAVLLSEHQQRLRLSRGAAKQKIAELPSRFEGDADDSPNDSADLSLSAPAVPSVTQKRLRMRMVAPPLLDLEASSESVRVGLVYGMSFLTLTASF